MMPTEAETQQVVKKLDAGMKAWESGCFACHDTDSDMNDPVKMQQMSSKTLALVAANEKIANEIEGGTEGRASSSTWRDAQTPGRSDSVWALVALCVLAVAVSVGVVSMVRAIGAA